MSNTLQYKGYTGSVEFSEEDECLFGKVLGVRALISYEGMSVQELKKDFMDSIDDYLAMCEQEGMTPEKSYKGSFNVRVSPDIHRDAAICAAESGLSLNSFVAQALSNAIKAFSGQPQI